jgi:hypothetical protein
MCGASRGELRSDIDNHASLLHHLSNPLTIESQRNLQTLCKGCLECVIRHEVFDGQVSLSSVPHHALHILPNHHGFQLTAGLPCELCLPMVLAGFFGNLARQPTPSRATNRRDIAAPLAADCQQATQRVQTSKETFALAGGYTQTLYPKPQQLPRPPTPTSQPYQTKKPEQTPPPNIPCALQPPNAPAHPNDTTP